MLSNTKSLVSNNLIFYFKFFFHQNFNVDNLILFLINNILLLFMCIFELLYIYTGVTLKIFV